VEGVSSSVGIGNNNLSLVPFLLKTRSKIFPLFDRVLSLVNSVTSSSIGRDLGLGDFVSFLAVALGVCWALFE